MLKCIVCSSNGQYVTIPINGDKIYVSSNYGSTWSYTGYNNLYISVACDATGQNQITAAQQERDIYMSSNYGSTWTVVPFFHNIAVRDYVAVSMDSTGELLTVKDANTTSTYSGMYTSSNHGTTWTLQTDSVLFPSSPQDNYNGLAYSNDGSILYFSDGDMRLLGSTNYGVTWTNISNNGNSTGSGFGQFLACNSTGSKLYLISDKIYINPPAGSPMISTSIPISSICFPAKTPVTTDQGEINIEDINPKIHTIRNKKIVTVTKTVTLDKYLVCFDKDALGKNIPSEKTKISKDHHILYKGKIMKAVEFVGKYDNVYRTKYNGEILYNILMENHDTMIINNMICETLYPDNIVIKLYRELHKLNKDEQEKIIVS